MSIRKSAFSGIKWTTVSTVSLAAAGLLRLSILARFLDKTDFGLMAMVLFVLGFMNLFMDMGLTSAILHKQDISKNEYSSLYWVNFSFSILLYLIVILITPTVSRFYNETELLKLLPIMCISLIISALGRLFKTIAQKNLQFRFIALVDISASLCSLGVATVFAIMGYGVYALVYSALTVYLISNLVYFIAGLKNKILFFRFNFKETMPFLKIGIYQVGSELTNYLNRDIDILIIGKLLGSDLLGGYSLAKQLVRRPLQIIDPILTKVSMSIFPRFQNDDNKLRKYFKKILINLAIVDAILYGTIAILAPFIVRLLYGPGYEDIVIYVRLLSVVVYLRSLTGQQGILVITKGRTDLGFIWNITLTVVFPVVIYIGALISLSSVILYLIVLHMIMLAPAWKLFYSNLINLRFNSFIKPIIYPLLIASVVYLTFYLIPGREELLNQILFSFILTFFLFAYAYYKSEDFRDSIVNMIH